MANSEMEAAVERLRALKELYEASEREAGLAAGRAWALHTMIAGTLILCRNCGPMPGYLMSRGTIVLAGDCEELSPTFVDCGTHGLIAMRLMAQFAGQYSKRAASLVSSRLRRLAGDMAVLGKGELFMKDRD